MKGVERCPAYSRSVCFAWKDGKCIILTSNGFGGRKCPFFKTSEQCEKEQAYCKERFENIAIMKKERN